MAGLPSDGIDDLFAARPHGPAQPKFYRQGTILEWNAADLTNRVSVGGAQMVNLPVLGVGEAASYRPGAVVGIDVVGSTWAIVGRFVIPGTPDAVDAITQLGQRFHSAEIAIGEGTNSPAFTDLATVGPTVAEVRIPASGKAYVTTSAYVVPGGATVFGAIDFEITVGGLQVRQPNTNTSLNMTGVNLGASRSVLVTGLTPGALHTFKAKYLSQNGSTQFFRRMLTIVTP